MEMEYRGGIDLVQIYNQCKKLDVYYTTKDYQKIFENEYEIMKSAVDFDNLFCGLLNDDDKIQHYYCVKDIDDQKIHQYLELLQKENCRKSFHIDNKDILVLPIHDDGISIGYYAFIRNEDIWDHESVQMLEKIIELFIIFFSHKNEYQDFFFKKSILLHLLKQLMETSV